MKNFISLAFVLFLININSYSQITKYVNPFIGTSNGGNTFPGAVVPWGMVSVSPHNAPGSPSGYIYGSNLFYGFGHTHLSGTGCSDFGSIIITANNDSINFNSTTSYSNEISKPGLYSLHLDNYDIDAEVTSTERCGLIKFSSSNSKPINIYIEAGKSLNLTGGGYVKIISPTEMEGYNISGGFCGETNRQIVYFYSKISQPADTMILWKGNSIVDNDSLSVKDSSIGCLLRFTSFNKDIIVKTGISYVNIENAKKNLQAEVEGFDFNKVADESKEKWEKVLSRIKVTDDNDSNKVKFFTAIYHMLIHPNIINDINGDYPLMGRNGIGNYKDRNRYTVFSLWDTYRTLHPFLTLVYPEVQSEIIKTMLDMYKEIGYLPKWELAGNETYMMVGDAASIVIADSYVKGIRDFDTKLAFDAVLKPTNIKANEQAPPVRAGYHELLQYGYIPFEQDWSTDWWVWGPVSTSLEYNLADWTISQMAYAMNRKDIGDTYLKRSMLYKNLFDTTTLFMRPKLKNGKWIEPFDSLAYEGSGDWKGSGGPGYVEGNAWNYTWFVPHDIPGLKKLFNDDKIFTSKLIRAFGEKHFTINNEPDFGYPYIFNYVKGKEDLANKYVKEIMNKEFGTSPNGLPGNDDCGTTSGWFVFSALGFYPECPASLEYSLATPLFSKIEISLNKKYYKGDKLIIEKKDNEIYLNNKKSNAYKVNHKDLINASKK